MANTLEVEGKEILIKSSKGLMAVIPKDKVSWVKGQIESGNHGVVDKYVNSLSEYKYDDQKAGNGLYANIHAKRERIAAGSGERMRKPGEAGAPTAGQFKQAAKTAKAEDGMMIKLPMKAIEKDVTRVSVQEPSMSKPKVVEKETMRIFPVGPLVPFNYYQERKKKEKQKAEEGIKIKPPVKEMAVDVSQVSPIVAPKIIPGQLLPEVSITAPAKVNTGIDYANPEDWSLIAPMLLKKANTAIGGNIERGGNDRESYSDLMWRLAHTRGTAQHYLHGTYPNVNKYAGVGGDVILDPVNVAPIGRGAKALLKGASAAVMASGATRQARNLNILGETAPWIDRAGDFYSAVKSYMGYGKKKEEGK